MSKLKNLPLLFLTLFILTVFFILIKNNSLYDDEPGNYTQIEIFLDKKWEIYEGYPQFPGYPFILANIALTLNQTSVPSLRTINFVFSLLSVFIFYLVAHRINPSTSAIKTLQFSFLPILFPFRFLLYSENLSNLLVLSSLFLVMNKKIFMAAVLSLVSVSVRQTNVIWFIFIYFYGFLQSGNMTLNLRKLFDYTVKNIIFPLGVASFVAVIIFNKGIAMGNQSYFHPSFTLNMGNVYWLLFLFCLLFIVHIAGSLQSIILLLYEKRILTPMLVFILICSLTFQNNHPWNQNPEHLRNRALLFFSSGLTNKIMFFVITSLSLIYISLTRLADGKFYPLYPFTVFALVPIWLIESRYAIIPLILFILFREISDRRLEWLTVIYFVLVSMYFFYGYLNQGFYL